MKARAIMLLWVHSKTFLFEQRSATDPPHMEKKSIGAEPTAATTPSNIFEPVSWYTSQLCAAFCIHVPISEIDCPMIKSRKLRCLSAENVCRNDSFPAATRRGWPVTSSGTVATSAFPRWDGAGMKHFTIAMPAVARIFRKRPLNHGNTKDEGPWMKRLRIGAVHRTDYFPTWAPPSLVEVTLR